MHLLPTKLASPSRMRAGCKLRTVEGGSNTLCTPLESPTTPLSDAAYEQFRTCGILGIADPQCDLPMVLPGLGCTGACYEEALDQQMRDVICSSALGLECTATPAPPCSETLDSAADAPGPAVAPADEAGLGSDATPPIGPGPLPSAATSMRPAHAGVLALASVVLACIVAVLH